MSEKLVELENITKSFGNVRALDQVNMYIGSAEIVGLNGEYLPVDVPGFAQRTGLYQRIRVIQHFLYLLFLRVRPEQV